MISIIDSGKLVNTDVSPMVPRSCEMVGLSTDTKPTGVSVGNGWSFIEMDTGKIYFYDAESETWLEFGQSGGGGGNASVTITNNGAEGFTLTIPSIYDGEVYNTLDWEDIDGSAVEVVLTNGSATLSYTAEPGYNLSFEVTGDITNNGDGTLTITGDGSIDIYHEA